MRKINSYLCLGILLFLGISCTNHDEVADSSPKINTNAAAFWNLTGNIVTHDPTLIQANGMWWSFSTGAGIGVKYSSNGLAWTQGVQRFGGELSWWRTYAPNMGSNDVWAPDVIYLNGRYWLFYSISSFGTNTSAIGLTSCTSILTGDWRDDGLVIASKGTNYNAIDPDVTVDGSGKVWMTFGSWFDGIKLVQLNSSTMKPTGSIYSIARRSGGIEAPDIVYTGGYYYLFVSIDKCCNGVNSTYKITYGRSSSITGPYTDKNGVSMLNGGGTVLDAGNTRWKGPGGQDIYNNKIIIRHSYDATDNGTPKMLINDLYF